MFSNGNVQYLIIFNVLRGGGGVPFRSKIMVFFQMKVIIILSQNIFDDLNVQNNCVYMYFK